MSRTESAVPRILIVGGGYAGFYTAWKLEKSLRRGEAEVTIVDPLPYMTYQPFLPEVAAGSIEPRYAVVSHRRHLKKTRIITAKVTAHPARIVVDVADPVRRYALTGMVCTGPIARAVYEEPDGAHTEELSGQSRLDNRFTVFLTGALPH